MVFRIVDFNKELDIYSVISNEGEHKNVTSFQIVKVMLQGYNFDNAYLTQKGFALQTNRGTRYIQVNLDRQTQMFVMQFLSKKKLDEEKQRHEIELAEQKRKEAEAERLRQQQEQQRREQLAKQEQQKKLDEQQKQNKPRINRVTATTPSIGRKVTKIQGSNRNEKIFYNGNMYFSEEQLCKKFNTDVEQFKKLRFKGYSIDEALGLKPLRPEEELVSFKKVSRMLDSMAAQRGEY